MFAGSSKDNGAGLVRFASMEFNEFVFSDDDFTNLISMTKNLFSSIWLIESGDDFCSSSNGQTLDTFEVSVFDDHDSLFGKELFRVVVYQLSIDEDSGLILHNFFDLVLHFIFFSLLDFGDLVHGVDLDFGSEDLDFIIVHWSVSAQNLAVLHDTGTSDRNGLFEDETVREERVSDGTAGLLDDVDVVEVGASIQSQNSINGELGKVLFILCQEFGTEGGSSNIQ